MGCVVETDDKPKFEDWLRPREALTKLQSAFSTEDVAKHLLLQRLGSGGITAVAETATWTGLATGKPYQGITTIPDDFWRDYYKYQTGFWDSGDLFFYLGHFRGSINSVSVTFHGIRFDPGGVDKLAKTSENRFKSPAPEVSLAPIAVEPPIQKNKGGKPPKPWWQDFWIEMCRLIYEGAIRPEMTQADIGRLMHQWVSDHGHEAGDTVIKDAARKLGAALKK